MHQPGSTDYRDRRALAVETELGYSGGVDSVVSRTVRAGRPGTLRWLQMHGSSLVCVRYRETLDQRERLITIELVVARKPGPATLVRVKLPPFDTELRRRAQALGASWDRRLRLWTMTKHTARLLELRGFTLME